MIKSQRSFTKFYLAITGLVSFFLIMAFLVGILHKHALSKAGDVVMILMSIVLVCLAVYTVVRYYKNAPTIEVDETSIIFNHRKKYYWADLEDISLTGKKTFIYILGSNEREATTLKFKDQPERFFFDDMYANSAEIKLFIQEFIADKDSAKTLKYSDQTINQQSIKTIYQGIPPQLLNTTYYKGYQLLSIEGFTCWLFCGSALFISIKEMFVLSIGGILVPVIFCAFIFLLLGFRLCYFGISSEGFIVKLHNVFWYKRVYSFADIKEVVFETRGKMPTCLRVITNDYKSKLYPAATIGSKTWLQMKGDLERLGIKVRNECVSYTPFEFKFKLFN